MGMRWHGTDINLELLLEYREFPAACPACGQKEAHIYIQADSEKRGGLWIWCSSCRIFEHASMIPPSYWENDAFTDSGRLTAVPEYLEGRKERIDAYMTAHYHGMDTDGCLGCIRRPDYKAAICPECMCRDAEAFLEGHSMIMRCRNCGYEAAGASFFAPCEADRVTYHIFIPVQNITPVQLVKLSSLIHQNSLAVKKVIQDGQLLPAGFSLKEIVEAEVFLKEAGIRYEVRPPVRYSLLAACSLKML